MNSRFLGSRSPRKDNGDSPRRRLRLFSMNDRQRKEQNLPPPPLEKPNIASRHKNGNLSRNEPIGFLPRPPLVSQSEASPTSAPRLPRTNSPPLSAPRTDPLAPRSNIESVPPARPNPPAPTMLASRQHAPATRPGVSFERHGSAVADPVAAKVSTFEQNRQSSRIIDDPIAAKIAAHDNARASPRSVVPPPIKYQQQEVTYMEIAPGEKVRLRGAKETWQAVENDFYLPTTCFSCDTDLCCIMDASYVLCPRCKVVSPVEGWAGGPDGGVGLGFTYGDLAQWQTEIMQRRQQQQVTY